VEERGEDAEKQHARDAEKAGSVAAMGGCAPGTQDKKAAEVRARDAEKKAAEARARDAGKKAAEARRRLRGFSG